MLVLRWILCIIFLIIGIAKMIGVKPFKKQFEEFHMNSKYMFFIGLLEVLGAVGLYIPQSSLLASIGLFLLMIGAIGSHYNAKHPFSKYIPSFLLLLALGYFIYIIGF